MGTTFERNVLDLVSEYFVSLVHWLLQVMFPSVNSFIVFWFSLSFTACFGLHDHLEMCRILHIFIFICLKDSASMLFWFVAPFFHLVTLCMFSICGVGKIWGITICPTHLKMAMQAETCSERRWKPTYNKAARRRKHNLQNPLNNTVQQDAKT
jgi:hypothetical protein